MINRILILFIVLHNFALSAHSLTSENELEEYIDSLVDNLSIDVVTLENEIYFYAKKNYKKITSVRELIEYIATKPKLKSFSNNYLFELKNLKLLSYTTHSEYKSLRNKTLSLISKEKNWKKINFLNYLYVFLHETMYWNLDSYKPSVLGKKLLQLYKYTESKTLVDKVVLFVLTEKIYKSNRYVNRKLKCESISFKTPVVDIEDNIKDSLKSLCDNDNLEFINFATFPGGETALKNYIKRNLDYPSKAKEEQIQGIVLVSFYVNKNGKVNQIKIIDSSNDILSKEVIRLVKSFPIWQPEMKNNKATLSRYVIPIKFELN